jgi:AcrR family transcriptional regulator
MTKKEPKEQRTEEIINAAVDVFLDKGYESTSMESIAERAGISKGGLYHHFSGKDEIFLYANQKLNEPIIAMMQNALDNPSPQQALNDYINQYIDYWSRHKREIEFFYLSMTKAMKSAELRSLYEDYLEEYIAFFESIFKSGIDKNEFIDHEPRSNAIVLIAALDGLIGYIDLSDKIDVNQIKMCLIEKFIQPVMK